MGPAFGYYSDDGLEYIITNPNTPMPWVNVISNGDYGLVISQAGSGYSWRTHASLNRINRWEQDLIRDRWGKYLYLRDRDTGEFWSPTCQPAGSGLQDYRVHQGMGYTVITSRRGDLRHEVTCFVPFNDPLEVWLVKIQNQGAQPRRLQLFTYLEWLLGAAPDWHREFHKTFLRVWYNAEHGVLLASKMLWELPGTSGPHWNTSWPYVAFHSASIRPAGFEGYKRAFLGRNRDLDATQALIDGQLHGTSGRWEDEIASLQLELPEQAQIEAALTLGCADNEVQALDLALRYQDLQAVHQALETVHHFWQSVRLDLVIETPDLALNRMVNGWLSYQAIVGRLWGRSAYYQTGGAYGFRDQLQDSLVWLLLGRPEKTLAQIRLHAAHQYQEGMVLHWWHPLAETGLKSEYSDDLLWLPFAVLYYLRATGDEASLNEVVPFFDGGSASLLDHCLHSFNKALERRSPRGLPLILKGDWNDGLNAVGAGGRGESMWMASFLYFLLREWARLPFVDSDTRKYFEDEAEKLRQAANQYGWDGGWYWRATTDDGQVIGSASNQEGQIFLNAQTWAALSGLAAPERAEQAMQAARAKLYQSYGPLLFSPAYTTPDPRIGYLTRYAPGMRENGGVYVHAGCWAVLAERKLHGAEAAYQLLRSFCPAARGQEPEVYGAEPYVMPGNVEGPASQFPGRAGWTWYTGSAAWYLRALIEGVLGVEATLGGLRVQAALPDGWDGYRIKSRFRRVTYDIQVRRADSGESIGCTIDGQPWQAETLPILEPGTEHLVKCTCR
jgi:cellobiose phosphorylase